MTFIRGLARSPRPADLRQIPADGEPKQLTRDSPGENEPGVFSGRVADALYHHGRAERMGYLGSSGLGRAEAVAAERASGLVWVAKQKLFSEKIRGSENV